MIYRIRYTFTISNSVFVFLRDMRDTRDIKDKRDMANYLKNQNSVVMRIS
jgi:hypothetical protein